MYMKVMTVTARIIITSDQDIKVDADDLLSRFGLPLIEDIEDTIKYNEKGYNVVLDNYSALITNVAGAHRA